MARCDVRSLLLSFSWLVPLRDDEPLRLAVALIRDLRRTGHCSASPEDLPRAWWADIRHEEVAWWIDRLAGDPGHGLADRTETHSNCDDSGADRCSCTRPGLHPSLVRAARMWSKTGFCLSGWMSTTVLRRPPWSIRRWP